MIEAVGREYWPVYFATLRDRLAEGGHIVLQAITIEDSRFEKYMTTPDFIQRYIFPGGALPCPRALRGRSAARGTSARNGRDLRRRLCAHARRVARRFHENWNQIEALGFDPSFRRLWDYYLCYCEGGFRSGAIDVGLYRLTHASIDGGR